MLGIRRFVALCALLAALGMLAVACGKESEGAVGEQVEVGDLDLTVLDVERLDEGTYALLSDANVRVRVRATNARGDEGDHYRLAPFVAFHLDDDHGVGHDPRACGGCEDAIEGLDLALDGTVTGWLYFNLDAEREAKALRYSPAFSKNQATIALD